MLVDLISDVVFKDSYLDSPDMSYFVDCVVYLPLQADLLDVVKPFKNDPAKQERFELFLQEKYHGGLRSTESGRASNLTESARARERLDFEAAAEAIEKGQLGGAKYASSTSSSGLQFTSAGVEVMFQNTANVFFFLESFCLNLLTVISWNFAGYLCPR